VDLVENEFRSVDIYLEMNFNLVIEHIFLIDLNCLITSFDCINISSIESVHNIILNHINILHIDFIND